MTPPVTATTTTIPETVDTCLAAPETDALPETQPQPSTQCDRFFISLYQPYLKNIPINPSIF
ncbi:MAG: hypothetical protein R2861_15130 [Desulfobacterales bacterium]